MNLNLPQLKEWKNFANKFVPGATSVELHPAAQYDDEGGYPNPEIYFQWRNQAGKEIPEPEFNEDYSNEDLVSDYQYKRWDLPYNLDNGFSGRYVIQFGVEE